LENYEVVYDAICRLGGARPNCITTECRMSQITGSRAIKELDTNYMIRRGKNLWYPTAVAKKVSQPPKSGQLSQDRSALRPVSEKPRGSGVVDQDADLPVVMKHIVDDLVMARARHNRLEGIRTIRAKISRKKRRMNMLDTEVTHDLRVLARLLWVAMTDGTGETDQAFQSWLTADMDRLVPGRREKVNQAVVELGRAA
jgi:hypothetical protein